MFLEASLKFQIDQGNLMMMLTSIINLKGGSMYWRTLILFPQTSNPSNLSSRIQRWSSCSPCMAQDELVEILF